MTSDTIVTGDNKTPVSSEDTIKQAPKCLWITAFMIAYLILMCDGADIGILAFSLTSLIAEWGLSSMQAGALGSWSLLGMGIGGFVGGWACDRFGRVRVIVLATITFSLLSAYSGFAQSYTRS